jgi:hypothetical protein
MELQLSFRKKNGSDNYPRNTLSSLIQDYQYFLVIYLDCLPKVLA